MSELTDLMDASQFYLSETGGGCTAYAREFPDGSVVLITRADDADAPSDVSEACTVGKNDPSGNWTLLGHADDVKVALSIAGRAASG
jgi:hypothetical protein